MPNTLKNTQFYNIAKKKIDRINPNLIYYLQIFAILEYSIFENFVTFIQWPECCQLLHSCKLFLKTLSPI